MNIAKRNCKEKAVYWAPSKKDHYGQFTFPAQREIDCRIEIKAEEFLGADGREAVSRAKVLVMEPLALGGWLYLGPISALGVGLSDPRTTQGAYEIRSTNNIPNQKVTQRSYSVYI